MQINLNGKNYVTGASTLEALAADRKLPESGVVMTVNDEVVPRGNAWQETALSEGLKVDVFTVVAGG